MVVADEFSQVSKKGSTMNNSLKSGRDSVSPNTNSIGLPELLNQSMQISKRNDKFNFNGKTSVTFDLSKKRACVTGSDG